MNHRIRDQIHQLRAESAPGDATPALVAEIVVGSTPLAVLAELAAQQHRIIRSDRRSLLLLATRCADRPLGGWFAELAAGESAALATLPALAAACGLGQDSLAARPPLAGCQAYPGYLAWLALNGEPAAAATALVANFAAWGGYCATVARALRIRYGFADDACGFFDFFAQPADAQELQAAEALGPDPLDPATLATAHEYARLLQAYEHLFWDTLAKPPTG